MPCTIERIAANRRNALKSTGPRTAEGKAASRGNSFRHGLTGEGVVLTDEDAAAVEERFAAFEADLKPANGVASAITRRAAILSVRMERCARQEAANLNERMLAAPGIEADERAAELAAHIEAVRTEPERRVRHLRLSPEGIDRMIAEWLELRAVLIDRDPLSWAGGYVSRMTDLLGTSAPRSWYCPTTEDRTAMAEVIDGCVAGLRAERSALDLEGVARSRAAAASRAIFDPSKGGGAGVEVRGGGGAGILSGVAGGRANRRVGPRCRCRNDFRRGGLALLLEPPSRCQVSHQK